MASPFHAFRKNMKPMLAFFVVLLMLSWVVGDSLFNFFAGNKSSASNSRSATGYGRELGWGKADQPADQRNGHAAADAE